MQRPIISCPALEKGLEVTSEDRKKIRELIKPAWRKYLQVCSELVKSRMGSPQEITYFRARASVDIFSVAWTELEIVYDEISKMIITQRSSNTQLNASCIDWTFKRMSLAQFMVSTLLQGGVSSYFSNFKTVIAPFIKDAYLQKKENDEA